MFPTTDWRALADAFYSRQPNVAPITINFMPDNGNNDESLTRKNNIGRKQIGFLSLGASMEEWNKVFLAQVAAETATINDNPTSSSAPPPHTLPPPTTSLPSSSSSHHKTNNNPNSLRSLDVNRLKSARLTGAPIPPPPPSNRGKSDYPSLQPARFRPEDTTSHQQEETPQDVGTFRGRPFKPPSQLGSTTTVPVSSKSSSTAPAPVKTALAAAAATSNNKKSPTNDENIHPRLRGLDPELVERIENEILESGQPITFQDIAGLGFAKQCIEELVVWPVRNPEFYTGLRQLPKGLLLFGPPGTGKTLIAKAIAHECNATFFSVSASSLTSKWIGEGEKTVRAMFAVAAARQPSIVFIDEVDSLLTQRSADENEASRRIKTEFLVQFDGAATDAGDVVLIIGATNRPQELDEAARRRFVRRLYIPLPDASTRVDLLRHLLKKNESHVTMEELNELGELTDGYSGADVTNLAREASMGPVREVLRKTGHSVQAPSTLRAIVRKDFDVALKSVKASVSSSDLTMFEKWDAEFGTQPYVE